MNGNLVEERGLGLTGSIAAESPLIIGGDSTGPLQGNECRIRDASIWKGFLPGEDQIQNIMKGEFTNAQAGLMAYWPMKEGQGSQLNDLAAGGRHAEISGDLKWLLFAKNLDDHRAFEPGETVRFGPVELYASKGEVTYQWYFNNQPIDGATDKTLTLTNITEDDIGNYFVRVDDDRDLTPIASSRVGLLKADWPMWRFDAARSAGTPVKLAEELHLQWVRELPEPKRAWRFQWDDRGKLDFDVGYSPVVQGDTIFVPSNVTDSVSAYRTDDGAEMWRFYADGPVRLAPVAYQGRVYFTSDDGHLYCVNGESGELIWKFQAGPSQQRLLGNERIINFWAARGGAVIEDGTVYFAAGIFPLHGIFVYALNAETGEVEWVNDTTSADYVQLPHGGARGLGGLVPQGYIAVNEDALVVSPGRGQSPAFLDRHTGEVLRAQFRGRKGEGGYAVHADGLGKLRNEMVHSRVEAVKSREAAIDWWGISMR